MASMQYPRTAINFVLNKRASMQRSSRRESQFYQPSWTACVFRFPIPPEKFASFPLGSRPHATWRSCAQPPPHEIRRRRLANMKSATFLIEATFPLTPLPSLLPRRRRHDTNGSPSQGSGLEPHSTRSEHVGVQHA